MPNAVKAAEAVEVAEKVEAAKVVSAEEAAADVIDSDAGSDPEVDAPAPKAAPKAKVEAEPLEAPGADVEDGDVYGYPKNTPVSAMTIEEQVNYYKHHWGIEKNFTRRQSATIQRLHKALDTAKAEGEAAARAEMRDVLTWAAFEAVAGSSVAPETLTALKGSIRLEVFRDAEGTPDRDKIRAFLAPYGSASMPVGSSDRRDSGDVTAYLEALRKK